MLALSIDLQTTINGVHLHILNAAGLEKYLPRETIQAYIERGTFTDIGYGLFVSSNLTMGDMAKVALPDNASYDFASPQSFWHSRENWQDYVWYYPPHSCMGEPFDVVTGFKNTVIEFMKNNGYFVNHSFTMVAS